MATPTRAFVAAGQPVVPRPVRYVELAEGAVRGGHHPALVNQGTSAEGVACDDENHQVFDSTIIDPVTGQSDPSDCRGDI